MTTDRDPITGPIPIYVRTIPGGAALDLSALTALVVADVLEALLDPDDTTAWDRLHDLADTDRTPAEGRLPYEELVADLADRASSRVPLYGPAALELTRRLRRAVAPRAVPSQRKAGAA
ncbi:hypothetical protein PUR49_05310 [Streptomyces sp. BE147]|uniref:hypothetical protein n=1 Tax=Streptomyces sp. BE147 TaxID=3002524 RepID=UPI002E7765AA|nr:hypothetical protein [Streptomyces sp. BE147]MEE1735933.1 hypothetical protein [Streptomyces sp. BE147]